MSELSRYQLWYGRDEAPAEARILRAGPVTMELVEGDLRSLRVGTVEVVRRIYVAVRDHNWLTIPGVYTMVERDIADDHFTLRFAVEHRQGAIDFRWQGTITGASDGTITYAMDGEVHSDFRYNRIGFCILHPPKAAAGQPYRGQTPDGEISGTLPQLIEPQRIVHGTILPLFPAVDRLAIDLKGGVGVRFTFSGDLFEMEDQRNWTDDSFKTYCTPLALPFPKDARRGQKLQQQVSIALDVPQVPEPVSSTQPQITLGQVAGPLPALGLGLSSSGQELTTREIALLRALRLSHLRADLHLQDDECADTFQRALRASAALHCGLELALFVSDDANRDLACLHTLLQEGGSALPIQRIFVFAEGALSGTGPWMPQVRALLARLLPGVPLALGTDAYFTQLNCDRPEIAASDGVVYSLNPQVHAFDEASLAETLAAQPVTVQTARALYPGRPIHISPVTLRPRFNPNATGPEPEPTPGELPAQVDPRQLSLFGAGWTLGSIASLASVRSLTCYETVGWRGLMEREAGSALPARFPSRPGMLFPLYYVFADLAPYAGGEVLACQSSDPLVVTGLALRNGTARRVLLANLTAQPQEIRVGPFASRMLALRQLDENTAHVALFDPDRFSRQETLVQVRDGYLTVRLAPYALARLDTKA